MSAATGICGVATTTTIICTVATAGGGAGLGALVCTYTGYAPCTATTKAIGVVCVHIGICGAVIVTTNDPVGSGEDGGGLAVICTGCEPTSVGLAHAG